VVVSSFIGRFWFAFSAAEVEAAAQAATEIAPSDNTAANEQGL